MPPITVCIPYAGSDPDRERALTYVCDRYGHLGYEVRVGVGDHHAWRKAEAIQDAISRASGDLLIVADADVWSDHLAEAISAVVGGEALWSTPHWQVKRLTAHATQQFIAGVPGPYALDEDHHGLPGGGITILSRATYELAPLDPRFLGWGGEDKAWAYALRTLAGRPVRVRQPLWHLWHQPQERMTRAVGSRENDLLRAEYAGAASQPARMRELIEEGRRWASNISSPSP